ncbi:hypothetical protein CK503_11775 [Aliifodinibius salipaludis]|uniref:Uncharacterized protein n=1 Tax=Fodinibius salipaludis TaxID=2032627 RepID=A0A2A2G982_9BACT|nr:hypothetical protein [Aliifodinibius salipaludis]PAU93407.1 hypothetical protein CK503_11775 [Aliifodinibius salipaludis]
MDDDSRSERERLKEEYKAHYRKVREIKERVSRAKRTQNIASALKSMDKTEMLNSFDDFLYSVKHKLASVEARLDLAMDSLAEEHEDNVSEQELDEEMRKSKAKDTLRQVKLEMGLLYNEIEEQANNIKVNKTIGRDSTALSDRSDNELKEE